MTTEMRQAELPDNLEQHEDGDAYAAWQAREGVKVITDFKFEDLNTVELGPWERKGGSGAIIQIPSPILTNDLHLVEIKPGGRSEPERHLYEEIMYVVAGRGTTSLWVDENHKQIIEWKAGSLLTIPLNAWYQHFNSSGSEPTRYASMTNAPPIIRTFQNEDFIFNNPYNFTDRYAGDEAGFFSGDGKLLRGSGDATIYRTNFVPDADTMALWEYSSRGAKGINTHFRLDGNVTNAHISEFPVGTYKKGHFHGAGPHLIILGGVGFSLLWWPGQEKIKVDWKKGSLVIVPADGMFHQHFNTGTEPARYLAMIAPNNTPAIGEGGIVSISKGRQAEYEDEDRDIHEIFEAELKKHGAQCKMAEFVPWCTAKAG